MITRKDTENNKRRLIVYKGSFSPPGSLHEQHVWAENRTDSLENNWNCSPSPVNHYDVNGTKACLAQLPAFTNQWNSYPHPKILGSIINIDKTASCSKWPFYVAPDLDGTTAHRLTG